MTQLKMTNESEISFSREWAMPNHKTFDIPPIRNLVERQVNNSQGVWIDPFSGGCDIADITNDLNPEKEADYHMDAVDFLNRFSENEIDGGVIFDPPYSPRQISECYDSIGLETTMESTQATFWSKAKNKIAEVCAPGARVVSCCWNSGGVGKGNGFEIDEILLVAHGGWHNDTIVTVEVCNQRTLNEWEDQ